jgi:hypothetical protein
MARNDGDETPTTRDYTVSDGGTIVCYASEKYNCVVVDTKITGGVNAFLVANEESDGHDADLMRCTDEINRVLREAMTKKREDERHLSILLTDRGPFLAWVRGGYGRDSDPAALARALRIEN